MLFTGLTITFLKEFLFGIWVTFPLLLSFALIITTLGQIVGKKEGWSRSDSFYWSFITATTVGYGDIRPQTSLSKILSIVVALTGFTLTGILVAVAIHAATIALAAHDAITKTR